jgi:hypothetical protein
LNLFFPERAEAGGEAGVEEFLYLREWEVGEVIGQKGEKQDSRMGSGSAVFFGGESPTDHLGDAVSSRVVT